MGKKIRVGTRTQTSLGRVTPQPPSPSPKKSGAGAIIAIILGGICVIAISLIVAYNVIVPNHAADLEQMYLKRASASEQSDYLDVRPYLNRSEAYEDDADKLDQVAAKCHAFITKYPQSLFVTAHKQINYPVVFGVPQFLGKKHQLFGKSLAGTVRTTLQEFDERYSRLRRHQHHKLELDEIAHRQQQRKEAERQHQLELAKLSQEQAREEKLAEYRAEIARVRGEISAVTLTHDYARAHTLLRPFLSLIDPYFAEILTWAQRKSKSLDMGIRAHALVYDSGSTLRGEQIEINIGADVRRVVDVVFFSRNKLKVKFSRWNAKERRNVVKRAELDVAQIPFSSYETLFRKALEKKGQDTEYELLMGHSLYFGGDRNRAGEILSGISDPAAEFLIEEIAAVD